MVSGETAIILLLLAVATIIFFTSKYKMNAFIVLILVSFLYGIFIDMPLVKVVGTIKKGFGSTISYIGIVIIAGTIISTMLEKTGATLSMANALLKITSKKRSPLAMSIAGYIVSIPVFCDSGFILLSPLNKYLAKKSGKSMTVMAVALASGLYASHCLVPPTPGPIGAAGVLRADLGLVIKFGIIISIPVMIAGYLWATMFAKKYYVEPQVDETYEEFKDKEDRLPSVVLSFAPLLVPIILILIKSITSYPTKPFNNKTVIKFFNFIGDPATALIIGVFLALFLVKKEQIKEAMSDWMTQGLKNGALILAITGAGGAFGAILKASSMTQFISESMSGLHIGIFLPFIIAAALKTAQGSSTVAIITTASIMTPLIGTLGLSPALTVLAIGSGAMTVSHANDSYFWIVSQFSGIEPTTAYKVYTGGTLILGIVSIVMTAILSIFVK